MRSIRAIAIFPLLLCACGGGGGGGGGGGNAAQQAALQLLQDCGLEGIAGLLDMLGITVAIVDPAATSTPAIDVMVADQMQGHIGWTADLGGDPAPELLGDIQFLDETGQPAEPPFDLTQFMAGGLGTLDQFLSQLPADWSIAFNINAVVPPLIVANIKFTYGAGAVSDVEGTVNVANAPCSVVFGFSGAALADLAGAFPAVMFDSSYVSMGTRFEGMTRFTGTDTATVDGQLDGAGATYRFAADLGAQTVTTIP